MEEIKKHSDSEIEVLTTESKIIDISDLKDTLTKAEEDMTAFETWVVEERKGRQAIIDELQGKVTQATNLGVVEVLAPL